MCAWRAPQDQLRLSNVSIGDVLHQILELARFHKVKVESAFTSAALAIMVVEGLGRRMDPDLDLVNIAAPFLVNKVIREKLDIHLPF